MRSELMNLTARDLRDFGMTPSEAVTEASKPFWRRPGQNGLLRGMSHKIHNVGAAKHIGRYSDAIETQPGLRWLHSSGTPGVGDNGLIPEGIEAQARLAWNHISAMLQAAGMSVGNLVKVTTSLTDARDIPAYTKVRAEFLGEFRPTFMLQIVPRLIKPEVLVEIEIIAASQ
jgi:2-iminobutanoate/2-iminopropanoate deaminase